MPVTGITSNRISLGLYLAVLFITLVTVHPSVSSWNDKSRLATTQSLVEQGTFAIDYSDFASTGDKVYINGHYYSDKPVTPSLMAAAVYFPLYHLGLELERSSNIAYYLIVLSVIKLFWIAGLVAFYKTLAVFGCREITALLLTGMLGFCTLYFTWSSVFNNHLIAASCLLLGFYFSVRYKHVEQAGSLALYAGLFFALAGCVDHATAIFYVAFIFYFSGYFMERKTHTFLYLVPLLFTVLPVFLINYQISGQILPFQMVPEFFEYEGSPWSNPSTLTGMGIKDPDFIPGYALKMLFGENGFIIYNPLLIIGIPCLVVEITKNRQFSEEAVVTGICTLIIMIYYFTTSKNFSGWSYSIRWFIPVLPFLFIFAFRYMEQIGIFAFRFIVIPLICLSCLFSFVGVIDPWADKEYTNMTFRSNFNKGLDYIDELKNIIAVQ